jgi:hypothetical protein
MSKENEREVRLNSNQVQQISDEELDRAAGGAGNKMWFVYCYTCERSLSSSALTEQGANSLAAEHRNMGHNVLISSIPG